METNKRKAFTVEADENLSERFSEQTLNRGYTKYRAIEGAIRLWLNLPNEVQSLLIQNKDDDIAKICNLLGIRLRKALYSTLAHDEKQPEHPDE